MKRTAAAAILAMTAFIGFSVGDAEAYPDGPVQVVVPAGPGGAVDSIARIIAQKLETKLGAPFPVVNVPGGASAIGARQVADAEPDGQTILISHQQLLVSAATGVLGFDVQEELVPLAQTGRMENFVVVPASAEFRDLKGLAAFATSNPEGLNAAVETAGLDHIVLLQLEQELGVKFNYVNIPGGGPPKVQSLMGGFSDLAVLGPGPLSGVYRSGDLAPIATLTDSDAPSTEFPEVPTTRAQGHSTEFFLTFWWLVPRETPQEIQDQISTALAEIMNDPEVKAQIQEQGGITEAAHWDAEAASANMDELLTEYEAIVNDFGLSR